MPISDYNEVFDEPTPPRSDAAGNGQGREESHKDAPPPPPKAPRQGKRPRAPREAEAPAEMDKDALGDWRWRLGASARKAAAAQQRAAEAARAWERVVTEARNAGVPDRLLMAAALEADIDLPTDN